MFVCDHLPTSALPIKSCLKSLKLKYFSSKMSDIDRKKAEVRARLEAQAAGKKAKKGFMTPERKKKLRVGSLIAQLLHNMSNMVFPAAAEEKGD